MGEGLARAREGVRTPPASRRRSVGRPHGSDRARTAGPPPGRPAGCAGFRAEVSTLHDPRTNCTRPGQKKPHCQRNQRSARRKAPTIHAPRIATSPQAAVSGSPSLYTVRRASLSAVRGSACTSGCMASG